MKKLLWLFAFTITNSFAQPSTDVYVMDLHGGAENFSIKNFRNITNNPGYDNQPSFMDNENILLAKNNNGQTDIEIFNLTSNHGSFVNKSTEGGEYSPQLIPNTSDVAAVRLDKDGKQRLYKYEVASGNFVELIKDIEVAYYAFHDQNRIIASILAGDKLDLVVIDLNEKEAFSYIENSGRSIHKVPGSNSVSYSLVNEEKNLDIYLLNIDEDGESFFVCQLPIGIQDYAWIDDATLLAGSGDQLYLYDLFGNGEWKKVASFKEKGIKDITRLAVSPNGKHLALVAEPVAEGGKELVTQESVLAVIDKQVTEYNKGDLQAFSNVFASDVIVNRFPNELMYQGRDKLLQEYEKFFAKNTNLSVEVLKRISNGDFVIDEELAQVSGKEYRGVAIYKVDDGEISSMTFINNQKTKEDPESIVQKQLDAYNNRDIDAFLATYSDDVVVHNYPDKLQFEGQKAMREGYEGFFANTPDLHCAITQRIVIGNKVIDKEDVTMNGRQFPFIAIYEVENGLISKVTFVR